MKKTITIYLAGKIQKAHENPNETYWTDEDQGVLKDKLAPYSVFFLNPAIRSDDLSDQKSVFGRDMMQVYSADFIFVDARERRGLGVGSEMMWAKMNGRPVLSLAPIGSHYHKEKTSLLGVEVDSWVHPFVENLSDTLVQTLDEGAAWIIEHLDSANFKGPEWIHEAMRYYKTKEFPKDQPMVELARNCPSLLEKIEG